MQNKQELIKVYVKSLDFKILSFKTDKVFYVDSNNPYWHFYSIQNEIFISDRFVTKISTLFGYQFEECESVLSELIIHDFSLTGIYMGVKKINPNLNFFAI